MLAMLMHRKFSMPVLTTWEVVGKATLSKHEASYRVHYRNLCTVGPDPNYNTDRTDCQPRDDGGRLG